MACHHGARITLQGVEFLLAYSALDSAECQAVDLVCFTQTSHFGHDEDFCGSAIPSSVRISRVDMGCKALWQSCTRLAGRVEGLERAEARGTGSEPGLCVRPTPNLKTAVLRFDV